jgi:ENTS family enterobactin (siderophore) exporter
LRESAPYRRLWAGLSLSNVGQQVAITAIGLQVYDLTRSSFAVGLTGLFGLVPLVLLGLYGGSIVDAHDRRRVALLASLVLWVVSIATAAQALLGLRSVLLLYLLVAGQSAAFAVTNPARSAIVPRLVRRELLPAANALAALSWTLGFAVGPFVGGLLVGRAGFGAAYCVDVVMYLAALYGIWRLPAMPPEGQVHRAGLRSVLEGLRFLGTRPNVRMTFLVDLAAMVLAQPRALFPAIGTVVLGGGPTTAGALGAAVAVGSMLAGAVSGPLGGVRRQGLAVIWCVVGWGAAIVGFGVCIAVAESSGGAPAHGVSAWIWPAALFLALAGAADAVSAVFRMTILQAATPDELRGRLQGVFIVVVAGGPRLGDVTAGSVGDGLGLGLAGILGGLACALVVVALHRAQPRFAHYDARAPEP